MMRTRSRFLTTCLRGAGAGLAATALALAATIAGPAQSAQAHGAPWSPISRGAACSPDNPAYSGIASCDAALAAGPPGALTNWDDERVHNVFGRDQEFVPDGQLCSGGLPQFRGLDLARTDWPSTVVTPGTTFAFQYRATIPHKGVFELYLTTQGYDPSKPLTWDELDPKPLAVYPDPPLDNAAYHFNITWPTDRTGHQVLYTIWRNTVLADTYYSCSDVYFLSQSLPSAAAIPAATGLRTAVGVQHHTAAAKKKPSTQGVPSVHVNIVPVAASGGVSADLLAAYTGGAVLALTVVTLLVLMLYLRRHSRSS